MLEGDTFTSVVHLQTLCVKTGFPEQWEHFSLMLHRSGCKKDNWQYLTVYKTDLTSKLYNSEFNIALIFFVQGRNPVLFILLPSTALRIWTCDFDLWAAVALGSMLQAQAACCSVISARTEHRKKKKWEHCDPQRRDQSLTDSYHSVSTYSQLQGIMGNWDILLFLLQSSLYLSAFLTLLSYSCFLFVSRPSHLLSFLQFHFLLFHPVLLPPPSIHHSLS